MKGTVFGGSVHCAEGVGFRDPRDEQAETLFDLDEPLLGPLARALEHKLRQRGPTRVEDLRDFALHETVYRPEHVIRSLKPLHDRRLLKADGPLRRSTIVELASAQQKPDHGAEVRGGGWRATS